MEPISRRTAVLTAVAGAGAVAAGCSVLQPAASSAGGTSVPPATDTPTATVATDSRPRWPLTGVLVDDASKLAHAAVAIKVSDVKAAHPQKGLNDADIVFVEPNGISYTRLCAVFHSEFADTVGPVRSIRPVDVPLLCPIKPVFGNTEASNWVMKYVGSHSQYIENLYYFKAKSAYLIDDTRHPLENAVFVHPDALRKLAKRNKAAPASLYLPFATGDDQPSTAASNQSAASVSIPWGPGNSFNTSYYYDPGSKKYLRNEPWGKHVLADGKRVNTDNVLVVRAKWSMDKIFAGHGADDPVVQIINKTGSFFYLHQGRAVQGSWTKGEVDDLFAFTLADGSALKIAPGRTFLELPQYNAKVQIKG